MGIKLTACGSMALIMTAIGGVPLLAAQTFVTRDSAGIEIVVSGPPAGAPRPSWTLSADPVLQVGSIDGEAATIFTRVWDALRLPDQRLVVVEASNCEIRVFGADGRHDRSFGACGDGPKEFGGPPFLSLLPPETLVVWDSGHHRLSRYSLDGRLLEQKTLLHALGRLSIGPFPRGRVWQLASTGELLWKGSGATGFPAEGPQVEERRVVYFDSRTETSHDFGSYPSGGTFWFRTAPQERHGMSNPYAPSAAVALNGGESRVSIGDPERWEIRSYDGSGHLLRILRSTIPRTRVTRAVVEQERDRLSEQARQLGMPLGTLQRAFDDLPAPAELPAIASISWDGSGHLWVGRRSGSHLVEAREYDVFDPDGRWVGSVALPDDISRIFEVGEGYVLVEWRDELAVPYVQVYELTRGRAPDLSEIGNEPSARANFDLILPSSERSVVSSEHMLIY